MASKKTTATSHAPAVAEPAVPTRRRVRAWPRIAMILGVMAVIVLILKVFGPNGATYDEYLELRRGMSQQEVADIVGQGDYWFHTEGDLKVVSWVNADGTYIKTVFDNDDVLVEASWETGWDPARENDAPPIVEK